VGRGRASAPWLARARFALAVTATLAANMANWGRCLPGICLELPSVGGIAIGGRRGGVNRPRLVESPRRPPGGRLKGLGPCSHIVTGVWGQ